MLGLRTLVIVNDKNTVPRKCASHEEVSITGGICELSGPIDEGLTASAALSTSGDLPGYRTAQPARARSPSWLFSCVEEGRVRR